jgi:hypothetical protein
MRSLAAFAIADMVAAKTLIGARRPFAGPTDPMW